MTIFFRRLAELSKESIINENQNYKDIIKDAFYKPAEVQGEILNKWNNWFTHYFQLLQKETLIDNERRRKMNTTNPKYVLRNYMAQLAIDAADNGDYSLVEELYTVLKKPYDDQPEYEKWFAKRPEWARHKVGCSMLSCSS